MLVGCEFSGAVRDAFLALGHDAMSCDLLPTDSPGPHYEGDVLDVIGDGWDLAVFHPPCTFLTKSGLRWLHDHERFPDRWPNMIDAAVFFRTLVAAPIPRVAVENPSMHRWATKIIGRRYDQLIQPYEFGHMERKGTGLWLRGLPPLVSTHDLKGETMARPAIERDRCHWAPPGADRWKRRSITYPGIAAAMAMQWGGNVREAAA